MGSQQRRGPKGWERSDERVKDDVCERLYERSDIDASEVSVQVQQGRVRIEGTVGERWQKHAIEDLVDAVPGVKDIENHVRVSREGGMGQSQSGSPSYGQSSSAMSGSEHSTGQSTTGVGGSSTMSGSSATGTAAGAAGTSSRRKE
jgi:hypothetical protein